MSETEYLVLTEKLNGITTLMSAQYINITEKLEEINLHLVRLNGKVGEHEKTLNECSIKFQKIDDYIESRDTGCPQLPRIVELETKSRIGISKRQLIIAIISIMVALSSIAYSIIKINESLRVKETQTLIHNQDSIIKSINAIK